MQKLFRIAAVSSMMFVAVAAKAASELPEAAHAAAGAGVVAPVDADIVAADQRATALMDAFDRGSRLTERSYDAIDPDGNAEQAVWKAIHGSAEIKQRAAAIGFYILQYSGSGYEISGMASPLALIVDHAEVTRMISYLEDYMANRKDRFAKRGHVQAVENKKAELETRLRELSPAVAVGAAEGSGGAAAGAGRRESDSE